MVRVFDLLLLTWWLFLVNWRFYDFWNQHLLLLSIHLRWIAVVHELWIALTFLRVQVVVHLSSELVVDFVTFTVDVDHGGLLPWPCHCRHIEQIDWRMLLPSIVSSFISGWQHWLLLWRLHSGRLLHSAFLFLDFELGTAFEFVIGVCVYDSFSGVGLSLISLPPRLPSLLSISLSVFLFRLTVILFLQGF